MRTLSRREVRIGALLGVWLAAAQLGAATPARAGSALRQVQAALLPGGGDARPYTVALSPDGAFVYASVDTANRVVVYSRDASSGLLTLVEEQVNNSGGVTSLVEPRPLGLSADGADLYVASAGDLRIVHFRRDETSGGLTFVGTYPGVLMPTKLRVAPDGRNVFVGSSEQMREYARDAVSGALTLRALDVFTNGLRARDIAATADAVHLYYTGAINAERGFLQIMPRDPFTGFRGAGGGQGYQGIFGLDGTIEALALPPGEQTLALAGDGFVSILGRQVGTLSMTGVQVVRESEGGVRGLLNAQDLAVTTAGTRVFVASPGDDFREEDNGNLVAFDRHPASGELAYAERLRADDDNGLRTANSVAVSPDGAHVYVAARNSNSLQVFADEPICPPAPREGCHVAERARLTIRGTVPAKRAMAFAWDAPAPIVLSGDPWGGTSYSLCLYHDVGGAAALAATAIAPHGRLDARRGWTRKTQGTALESFKYRDPFLTPEGVRSLKVFRDRVRFRAKGARLPAPELPLGLPVVAQIATNFAGCWTAEFGAGEVRVNDPGRGLFTARL